MRSPTARVPADSPSRLSVSSNLGSVPGGGAFAMAPPDEQRQPVVRPGPDEPASYEQHVRTFFRKKDRDSTQRAFDLWS